ncbi:MAG: sugar phosphate nucleotidyltransferase [Bacillota bacterium]|jgi:glucose-1-phosphate thymidylyltransferase
MKAVIPLAGLGTRLRPQTYSKPKPLVNVAGKPVLGHVLDLLSDLPIDQYIFITGYLGEQIEEYVQSREHKLNAVFVEQKERKGQSHAIHLAKEYLDSDLLILFVDTLFEYPIRRLIHTSGDGTLLVKEVADPRQYGVVVLENGRITRLVEKPSTPVSNLAVIGAYYIRNHKLFLECLEKQVTSGETNKGEYYLADCLQMMIDQGAELRADNVGVWLDCGSSDNLLEANRYLLKKSHYVGGQVENSILKPPVYIADSAVVKNCVLGPHVSVASGVHVEESIISDSIISEEAIIAKTHLRGSLIGKNARVQGTPVRLNVGDHSEISY